MNMEALFDKWCKKLRISPQWDVKLELVQDPAWRKTGDFKIDPDDRKAVLLLNASNPKQENMEEGIVHELMHIKMYPPLKRIRRPGTLHTASSFPIWKQQWRR